MKRATLRCKHDLGDGLDNRILQEVVFEAQAVSIEETCDFLTGLEKVLHVTQHRHSQCLHLHDNLARVDLAVVLLHLDSTSLPQLLADVEAEFAQSFSVRSIQ